MSATVEVGVVRVIGPCPQRHRGEADRAVRRLADDISDYRTLLFVRRLSAHGGDIGAASRQLAELRRRAARPSSGAIPSDAAAVEFADEAEMLAALTEDIVNGLARFRWWWKGRLPRHSASNAETLEAVWLSEPRWVAPALTVLHQRAPHTARRAVAALPAPAAARVRTSVAIAYQMPRSTVADSPPGPNIAASPDAAVPPPRPAPPPGPNIAASPDAAVPSPRPATPPGPSGVDPHDTAITGDELIDAPDGSVGPEQLALLRDCLRLTVGPPRSGEYPADGWLHLVERPRPLESTALPTKHTAIQSDSNQDGTPATARDIDGDDCEPIISRADAPSDQPANAPREARIIAFPRRDRTRPKMPAADSPPMQLHPWEGSGPTFPTRLASAMYAVNLMRRLPDHGSEHMSAGRSGWAVLEAVIRWLLRGMPSPRRRDLLGDPLLAMLAWLDGREAPDPTPVRLERNTRPLQAFLDEHHVPVESFLKPGRVLVSRTHVDVLLRIDQIDMTARRCGLDQDPGWVPTLGRIVLFHFEDGA